MGGKEAAAIIRAKDRHAPIIFLTGEAKLFHGSHVSHDTALLFEGRACLCTYVSMGLVAEDVALIATSGDSKDP